MNESANAVKDIQQSRVWIGDKSGIYMMLVDFLQSFHNAGKTLITITHNRQLAETIGTRFACMNEEHELKML